MILDQGKGKGKELQSNTIRNEKKKTRERACRIELNDSGSDANVVEIRTRFPLCPTKINSMKLQTNSIESFHLVSWANQCKMIV